MTISERLGTLDASFLELEDANDAAHMHIDAVMLFEARPQGPPPLEELRSELGRRIEQLPHYRARLSHAHILRYGIEQSLVDLRSLARTCTRPAGRCRPRADCGGHGRHGRGDPRAVTPLREVEVGSASLERFRTVLTEEQWERLQRAAKRARHGFEGRNVWNVNSTARGGGVAELLGSLVPYSRGAGVDVRWVVIEGDEPFFRVTKRLHNMLHGAPGDGAGLHAADEAAYLAVADRNARAHSLGAARRPRAGARPPDRGPRCAAPRTRGAGRMALPRRRRHAQRPSPRRVGLPAAACQGADRAVFSRLAFVWEGLDRARVLVIPPSIDAFTPKNQPLPPGTVEAILRASGAHEGDGSAAYFSRLDGTPGRIDRRIERNGSPALPATASAVVQVSRWDRLKDPVGVLHGFREGIAQSTDAHLVLAAPSTAAVADDPEGAETLAEVTAARMRMPPEQRERVHLFSLPTDDLEENAAIVNALQHRAP